MADLNVDEDRVKEMCICILLLLLMFKYALIRVINLPGTESKTLLSRTPKSCHCWHIDKSGMLFRKD